MQKRVYSLFLISILILSTFVLAAGSSTGARSDSISDDDKQDSNKVIQKRIKARDKIQNITDKNEAARVCEDSDNRTERIHCRLAYIKKHKTDYEAPTDTIPEACRNLKNTGQCRKLYNALQQCYELEGRLKNKCFKRIAGFVRANLADEDISDRKQKARNYIVALLYDIQEKIEHAIENDRIDETLGTEIIDLIVEIKQAILNGEGREVVKPMIQNLREKLQELKQTLDYDEEREYDENETVGGNDSENE